MKKIKMEGTKYVEEEADIADELLGSEFGE